jgi:hypothetical protein
MNDQELRALVRGIVAARLADREPPASPEPPASVDDCRDHPSHRVFVALVNVGDTCLIEPSVPCNHCEYCRSHGH